MTTNAQAKRSYTQRKSGAVSRNLQRLRSEAGIQRSELASETGISGVTLAKMEHDYEPPSNHPYLQIIAKVLAAHVGRTESDVLAELEKGGEPIEFTNTQLASMFNKHRELAPPGLYRDAAPKTKGGKPAKGDRLGQLIRVLQTNKQIKSAASMMRLPLPNATVDAAGKPLKQDDKSIRLRALHLRRKLVKEGVDIDGFVEGTNGTARTRRTRGSASVLDNFYELVCRFNQARMVKDRDIKISIDKLEPVLRDMLRQNDIDQGVLLPPDFEKLYPKALT